MTVSRLGHHCRRLLSSRLPAASVAKDPPFVPGRCYYQTTTGALQETDKHWHLDAKLHPSSARLPENWKESIQGPQGKYWDAHHQSIQDPQAFWKHASQALHWDQEPTEILLQDGPFTTWFGNGKTNMSTNCLDVHLRDRADQVALYYDSPVTNTKGQMTYRELHTQVSKLAGALQNDFDIQVGDTVIIYMPMIPQAIVAMLACGRIGAVHSVVFGGFAAPELAARLMDCQPKCIVSAVAGVEPNRIVEYQPLIRQALELVQQEEPELSVQANIVFQRPNVMPDYQLPTNNDAIVPHYDFESVLQSASPVDAIPLPSTHPHNILYTSGTTGKPKGVVRDTGGYATALKWSMTHFYNTLPGQVFWAASDIGWVVGHSYAVYGPLLQGCSTVIYEGKPVGTPDAGAFWRVLSEYNVHTLFVAPTAFRAIRQANPTGSLVQAYDLTKFRALFVAGEHCDPETIHWLEEHILPPHVPPPLDHWWQTELGWPAVGTPLGLSNQKNMPVRYGSCGLPNVGCEVEILDADTGLPLDEPNILGHLVLKTPLFPGALKTLYKNDERFLLEYLQKYPGYYDTGDAAYRDDDGYLYIMGRTDDVINIAGHRLSTGAMEEVLLKHAAVAECAVIPVNDAIKGQVPIGFVVCNQTVSMDQHDTICQELIQLVRSSIGPVASFRKVAVVSKLPKTRSGKILRGTMSKIANGQSYKITPTIEDASVFDTLEPEIVNLVNQSSSK